MKQFTKLLCAGLATICLLSACTTGDSNSTTTKKPQPTTTPLPVIADINRPLPVLAEKKVTDTPAAGDLVLAENGIAKATIVYASANNKAKSAAQDLASYLQKIVGSAFPMISDDQTLPEGNLILVGMTKKTAELGFAPISGYPKGESFYIGTKDNCLILYGNDEKVYTCTQFAVTRFLEEAGCGWYAEEALWNVVPSMPTLAVKPWDQTFQPKFDTRRLGWVSPTPMNRWYVGGDSFSFGHTLWTGKSGLVSPDLYTDHPDWFAMIDGQRPTPTAEWQYCYTNQGLIEYVANAIISQFNRNPSLTTYSVSANDGWDEGWCDCGVCLSKGSRSDQMLYFANSIAEIVCKVHPDKRINFLAYHATFLPPESDMKAHPNVEVMFCMETNPFTDPTLDYVVHKGLNGMTKVEYSQSWQDNVRQWIEQTDLQHTSIWCWLCISTGNGQWLGAPWIQGNTITRTYELYEDLGVDIVFADWGEEMLRVRWPLLYTYARSMWDDQADAETILYDACQKLYGEAADEMFLYYRLLSDCAAVNVDDGGLTWVPPSMFSTYGDYIIEIRDAVAAASAKMDRLTPEQKERVKFQLSTWAYVEAIM